MSKLEKGLPKVVESVLKEEDDNMKTLVAALIRSVINNQNKSNSYSIIKSTLDTEIEKLQLLELNKEY